METNRQLEGLQQKLQEGVAVKFGQVTVDKIEEEKFTQIMTQLKTLVGETDRIAELTGIILFDHDDKFFNLIEFLLEQLYGKNNAELIMWWVYSKNAKDLGVDIDFVEEFDSEEFDDNYKEIDSIAELFKLLNKKKKK